MKVVARNILAAGHAVIACGDTKRAVRLPAQEPSVSEAGMSRLPAGISSLQAGEDVNRESTGCAGRSR
jgi:hypothetical protein